MKTLRVLALLVCCAAVFCLVGCDGKPPGQKAPGRVKIGAIIPLSGEVATYGQALKKGFDLAVEEYDGEFEIIYEDSKGDPKEGVTAFQKLRGANKVDFYLGDATSGVCLAIAPLAQQNRCVMMISIATSDDLRTVGDYILKNAPLNHKQAVAAADFVEKTLKASKVAILCKQSPYGANLAKVFREEAPRRGFSLVFDDNYAENTRDFTDVATRLNASGATAVFVPGNYEETAALLRRTRELGSKAQFVGTDGAYSPKLVELAGSASEGFVVTMMTVDPSAPLTKSFDEKFEGKYKKKPDIFSSYGYEGAHILMSAVKQAQASVTGTKDILYANAFESLTGPLRFGKNGEVDRVYGVLVVKGGAFQEYKE
jgi:branched-chain amino acid transport system substrate-binding protein